MSARPRRTTRKQLYGISYFGPKNRFIMAEEVLVYGYDDAAFHAGRSMPSGAVAFNITDPEVEVRDGATAMHETIRRLQSER